MTDGSNESGHVVIVGCGRVGSSLAKILSGDGHTVAVIDKRATAFKRIDAELPVQKLVGVGFDRGLLQKAGIERAVALAAVTSGDNSNILVARVARENFGVERVLARIYDPRRAAIYERVGISTVATVQWTIEQVLQRLMPSDEREVWTDASARVVLVERPVPKNWAGRPLIELEEAGSRRVIALTRLGAGMIVSPDHVAQEGDMLHIAVTRDQIQELDALLADDGGAHR